MLFLRFGPSERKFPHRFVSSDASPAANISPDRAEVCAEQPRNPQDPLQPEHYWTVSADAGTNIRERKKVHTDIWSLDNTGLQNDRTEISTASTLRCVSSPLLVQKFSRLRTQYLPVT